MIDRLPPRNRAAGADHRQQERSAWHKLARTLLKDPQAQFEYNQVGAPQIVGSHLHISVSHSRELVAVIVSPQRCAIDIESLSRNFERVSSRYISPLEKSLLTQGATSRALIWSIKETLYKYAGVKELDLLNGLRVSVLTHADFVGSIDPHIEPIHGSVATLFDHSLAYIG